MSEEYRVLVAYASASGSTAEVAEVIAQELASGHMVVEVLPVQEVSNVERYDAVVLGSSIRAGRWLPGAVRFLEERRETLAEVPVAYFTTCLTMVEDTPETRQLVLSYLEPVLQLAPEVRPLGLGLFAGSLVPDLEQVVPGGPYGDFRDWDAIRAWAREIRASLPPVEFTGKDPYELSEAMLSYSDLSGSDLRKADLRGAKLRRTKLDEARLGDADLSESDLSGARLQGADLEEASLGWADLHEGDLREARLARANLIGANLRRADLRAADLRQAILNGADLTRADLRGADLRAADLNWARLEKADLRDANLVRANLGWADLSKANLSGADLTEARYNSQTRWPEGFSPDRAGCTFVPGGF